MPCSPTLSTIENNYNTLLMRFNDYIIENNIDVNTIDEDEFDIIYNDWYLTTPEYLTNIEEDLIEEYNSDNDMTEEERRYYMMDEEDQYYYRLENNLDRDLNPLPDNINTYIDNESEDEKPIKKSILVIDSDDDDN